MPYWLPAPVLGRLSTDRSGGLGIKQCSISILTPSSFIQPALGSG